MVAPAGARAAPSDPYAPSKEIVAAMVEQFGLTPKEARDRIRAEGTASDIREAAQQAAGAAFAGAYFDKTSAVLVVAVTTSAVFDAVRATGAQPTLVSASYAVLEQALHVLDSRTGTAPAQVVGWRIDEQANTVVVDVAGGPSQSVKTFVSGLAHVTVNYNQPPPHTTADLIGGMAILGGSARCSLGFSTRNAAGVVYIVTAGHCTNLGGTWTGSAGTIGPVAGTSFPTNDYGRIQRTNTAWVPTSKIQGGSSVLGGHAYDRLRPAGRLGRTVRQQHPPGPGRPVGRQRQLHDRRNDVLPAAQRDPVRLRLPNHAAGSICRIRQIHQRGQQTPPRQLRLTMTCLSSVYSSSA